MFQKGSVQNRFFFALPSLTFCFFTALRFYGSQGVIACAGTGFPTLQVAKYGAVLRLQSCPGLTLQATLDVLSLLAPVFNFSIPP